MITALLLALATQAGGDVPVRAGGGAGPALAAFVGGNQIPMGALELHVDVLPFGALGDGFFEGFFDGAVVRGTLAGMADPLAFGTIFRRGSVALGMCYEGRFEPVAPTGCLQLEAGLSGYAPGGVGVDFGLTPTTGVRWLFDDRLSFHALIAVPATFFNAVTVALYPRLVIGASFEIL